MKTQFLSFTIPQPKVRAHRVLFQEDTPFKPKVVESKLKFKRRPKHIKRDLT
jgi:hypothetical protein